MSGNYDRLDIGLEVFHKGKKKVVKDWFFTSDPDGVHNSDVIVIQFEDGSTTKDEGFTHIRYLDEGKEEKPEKKTREDLFREALGHLYSEPK